uniref:Uncharacterized protein n=1 Tax=Arundo donax TaxID=35708 RepID=A0A0A8ZKI3_ARUDO
MTDDCAWWLKRYDSFLKATRENSLRWLLCFSIVLQCPRGVLLLYWIVHYFN